MCCISFVKNSINLISKKVKLFFNKTKITVVGYFGYDNIGDEFILHSLIQKHRNEKIFFVLSNNPHQTSKIHKVASFSKKIFLLFLNLLLSDKLIIE
ncbi:hypothetical protein XJ44_04130 [Thermosipho affectus]|uniref:Polysaccharide pyruvyl transferase domain-containing protein n=2 Tax=Thermosipho TaxID=2420 RepID=A0A1M5RM58_9BACT|nr:hypothetical protein XJ44_04130 [Thermosipho affectus]SHH26963.1 hypothetical protein SAMN02745199_0482 [Thermosipho atlanticus DSM 15807]